MRWQGSRGDPSWPLGLNYVNTKLSSVEAASLGQLVLVAVKNDNAGVVIYCRTEMGELKGAKAYVSSHF